MNQFFEGSVLPASTPENHVRPEDQVSWKMSDERLERRERAREIVRARRGGKR